MNVNTESQVLNVPIEDVIPNRFQPRINFDEDGLNELAASIKEHGIIQPLVLRRLGDKYEIIAGERRYKASKIAGLTSVPAIVSALDDKKSAEVAIVENVQRRDLSSIEEAKSYKALLDKGYLTQEELAKKMGLSQSAISNKLRLLSLSPAVQDALMEGKISERHARSLLQVSDMSEQEIWLNKIIEERITVRELEKRLKEELAAKVEEVKEDIVVNEPIEPMIEEKVLDQPIIDFVPNIEEIKANTEDIIPIKLEEKQEEILPVYNPKIPNRFFNFLEDESANMSLIEPKESEVEEEVELLDFDVPETVELEEIVEPEKTTDFIKSNNLIDQLVFDLTTNGFKVDLVKDELTDQMRYIITVEK